MSGDGTSQHPSEGLAEAQLAVVGPRLESLVAEVRGIGEEISAMRKELSEHATLVVTELGQQRAVLDQILKAVGAGRDTRPISLLEYTAFSELEVRARHFAATMGEEETDQARASHEMGLVFDALENLTAVRESTKPGSSPEPEAEEG